MALRFKTERKTDTRNVNTGAGTYTIDVDFVPNYIDVKFTDVKNKPGADSASWTATATATGYTFTVDYVCNEQRSLKFVAAKLPVDPEHTISF